VSSELNRYPHDLLDNEQGMSQMSTTETLVVGAGYVGLTTAACLASLGHVVVCADIDEARVSRLCAGRVDILEPGLPELVAAGMEQGRLSFVTAIRAAAGNADMVFLCVPTPSGPRGVADLTSVRSVITELRSYLAPGSIVVNRSTVPPGTGGWITDLLARPDVDVVSNPEFLREGFAVTDFLNPTRVVLGSSSPGARQRVAEVYTRIATQVVQCNHSSAELIKYASNSFLVTKLSFLNEIAQLCEVFGAEISSVTRGMGLDDRIGHAFLSPGPGWGGPCLPKDAESLLYAAREAGVDFALLEAAIDTNKRQRDRVVEKIRVMASGRLSGAKVGLLGLTFKAGTNDLRASPALATAELLRVEGAELSAYDPGLDPSTTLAGIALTDNPYQAVKGANVVVLLTDWPMFRELDWSRMVENMDGRSVVDARNCLDHRELRKLGLRTCGIGIPSVG
jgi:UDPglucose 6-dehydrogenase